MRNTIFAFAVLLASLPVHAQLVNGSRGFPQPNDATTGTTLYGTATINLAGNAINATTSNTTVAAYIVVCPTAAASCPSYNGKTGNAALAENGTLAPCTMDSNIASSAGGYYVVNSTTTLAGPECHAQSAAPGGGTWVIGYLAANSTTSGSTALVAVNGFIFGGGVPGIAGRSVTITTDTILAADCNPPERIDYTGSASVAVTLPTATTLGTPACVFKLANDTTGTSSNITVTPTTWTVNGASSVTISQGSQLWFYVDPASATNWKTDSNTSSDMPFFGPPAALNKPCVVDGVYHTTWQSCVDDFVAITMAGGVIIDPSCAHDITVNPYHSSTLGAGWLPVQIFCGVGLHPATGTKCGGTSFTNCISAEVPLVTPNGSKVKGSGRVGQIDDPSVGTLIVNGPNFPTALGPTSPVTVTCNPSGGSIAAVPTHVVVMGYNNLDPSGRVQPTPGGAGHSADIETAACGSGAASLTVNAPSVQTPTCGGGACAENFASQEFLTFSSIDYSGTSGAGLGINTFNSNVGNCTYITGLSGCATIQAFAAPAGTTSLGSFNHNSQGSTICIGSATYPCPAANTYVITAEYSSMTVGVSPPPGNQSNVAFHSSFGAWAQNIVGTNATCPGGSAGTIDPSGCTLGSTSMLLTTLGTGQLAILVDYSNPLIVMGDGNSSNIEFGASYENLGIANSNTASVISSVVDSQATSTLVLWNSCQEGCYIQDVNYAGGAAETYNLFQNDAPNTELSRGIMGGGPGGGGGTEGFSGGATVTASATGLCPANGGFASTTGACVTIGGTGRHAHTNWAGQGITINGTPGTVNAIVGQVYSPTLFSIAATSLPTSGTYKMRGVFSCGIIDGDFNPLSVANGTVRLIKNISCSIKSGSWATDYIVTGNRGFTEIGVAHTEQSVTTGGDDILVENQASPTIIADKYQAQVNIMHLLASAGGGSIQNVNTGGAACAQDDNFKWYGIGNGNGGASHIASPTGATSPCSYTAGQIIDFGGITFTGNTININTLIPLTSTAFGTAPDVICTLPIVHKLSIAPAYAPAGFEAEIYWQQGTTASHVNFGAVLSTVPATNGLKINVETCTTSPCTSTAINTINTITTTPTSILAGGTQIAPGAATTTYKTHISGTITPSTTLDTQLSILGITDNASDALNILGGSKCFLTN